MKIVSVPSKLSMNKNSHVILKPKIRIIHVFEPKIIETDVANFREMVQKFTGKVSDGGSKSKLVSQMLEEAGYNSRSSKSGGEVKEKKDLYKSENPINDFLGGFAELDYGSLFDDDQVTESSAFPAKSSTHYAKLPLSQLNS